MLGPSTHDLPEILAAHADWLANPDTGQRANLSGADLGKANLYEVNLYEANLSGADLSGASLGKADLSGANLRGAIFDGANLSGASLGRANLRGAYLVETNLGRANLSEADLSGASLRGADLSGANLGKVNLYKANLRGADLSGANLSGASLGKADLSGAIGIVIAADAPQRLRAAAAAALQYGALNMHSWHSCDTTHCLGGWLIYQAGEVGRLLEAAVGPSVAGLMLGGVEAHNHFYDSNKAATEYLRSVLAQPEVTR